MFRLTLLHRNQQNVFALFLLIIWLTSLFRSYLTCNCDCHCPDNSVCIRSSCSCKFGYALKSTNDILKLVYDKEGNRVPYKTSTCLAQNCYNQTNDFCLDLFGPHTVCWNNLCVCEQAYYVERFSQHCVLNETQISVTTTEYPKAEYYKNNANTVTILEIVALVALVLLVSSFVGGCWIYIRRRKRLSTLMQQSSKEIEELAPVRPAPPVPLPLPKSVVNLAAQQQINKSTKSIKNDTTLNLPKPTSIIRPSIRDFSSDNSNDRNLSTASETNRDLENSSNYFNPLEPLPELTSHPAPFRMRINGQIMETNETENLYDSLQIE